MDVSYQENFERFVAEMRGSSKDVPLRPVLEMNFHYTLARVDDNKADEYLEAFADDVTLIHETKSFGTILKGKQELASYFRSKHLAYTRIKTLPIVTIVDRDRITCYAEQYLYHGKDGVMSTMLIICDLNDSQLIGRMEYRKVKADLSFLELEGLSMRVNAKLRRMPVQYSI